MGLAQDRNGSRAQHHCQLPVHERETAVGVNHGIEVRGVDDTIVLGEIIPVLPVETA